MRDAGEWYSVGQPHIGATGIKPAPPHATQHHSNNRSNSNTSKSNYHIAMKVINVLLALAATAAASATPAAKSIETIQAVQALQAIDSIMMAAGEGGQECCSNWTVPCLACKWGVPSSLVCSVVPPILASLVGC